MKYFNFCAAAMLLCTAMQPASGATLGLQVSQLAAQATSVDLPSTPAFPCAPGACPATGDISIAFRPGPTGRFNQATGEGSIYYGASANFPLLGALGLPPVQLTLAGTFFSSVPDSSLISVDLGYADIPSLGRIYISNVSQDNKNISSLQSGGPGTTVNGVFADLTAGQYSTLVQGRLRGMLDDALAGLQAIDPLVPPIAPAALDAIKALYDANPSTELVLYFPDATPGDQLRLSQLTGTDALTLAAIPEPATLALLAAGLLALARRRRHGRADRAR